MTAQASPQKPVLLIEDEEVLLAFLKTALERGGVTVLGTSSGEDALQLLASKEFSGIVSDLRMPGPIGGAEIYEWVARHKPALTQCFLFITGNVLDTYAIEVRKQTGALFIQKPFRISLLLELIQKMTTSGVSADE
jgi:DNA-binding NtrC family response regulator